LQFFFFEVYPYGSAAVAAGNFMKTADPGIPILIVLGKSAIVLQNATIRRSIQMFQTLIDMV
jgi:hypothetical protein